MSRFVHSPTRIDALHCRYCGFGGMLRDSKGRIAHTATTCLHCGIRTCMGVNSKCPRCYFGLLAGWSGHSGSCERARCEKPRAAYIRRRYICADHAGPPVIPDPKKQHYLMRLVEVPDELDEERGPR